MNRTSALARVFHKDKIVRAGAGFALAALTATGWLLFAGSGDSENNGYTHMHCPVCEEEVPYSARLAGSECPSCGTGAVYVATRGSLREGTIGPSTGAKILVFLVVSVVLGQGLALLACQRSRVLHEREEEARNRLHVCRCPNCQRKIGFRAAQVGTAGVCLRCKTAFVFEE